MANQESFCARCARHIKNCCQLPDVYITLGDCQRIGQYSGRSDFCEVRVSDDANYLLQDDDPEWHHYVIRPDGGRRILKHKPNGDCTFLTPTGCALPLEVRPLVCRLYPWDYTAEGISDQLAPGCPVHLLEPGQDLIQTLNMTPDEARRWHRQLYEEIRWEETRQCELV